MDTNGFREKKPLPAARNAKAGYGINQIKTKGRNMKTCYKCGTQKPLSEFSKNKLIKDGNNLLQRM